MKSFTEICEKYSNPNTHDGTDKTTTHCYGLVYDVEFEPFRNTTKNILEIGIDGGYGLLAYADYFESATIYGIDIANRCTGKVRENLRIKTQIHDATDKAFVNSIQETFDIIIEDGSHFLEHQIQHCDDFLPKVNPGGLYIIEDVADRNLEALKVAVQDLAKKHNATLEIKDLRHVKHRFDDILFILRKNA